MLLVLLGPLAAWAARPMATDDTSTAESGTCQVEAWADGVDDARSATVAPACGLRAELELDTAFSRLTGQAGGGGLAGASAGLKWVPSAASFETAMGTVRLGTSAYGAWARDAVRGWRNDQVVLVLLSSLTPLPELNFYANAFATHDLNGGQHIRGARAAAAWRQGDRWLLFVEALSASDATRAVNAGLRFWLQPEVLGLDLVGSRSRAADQRLGTGVNIGLGWYGLRLF